MSWVNFAIISVSTAAIVGLIVFFIVLRRRKKVQFDFTTKDGIDIKLSPLLSGLAAETIEEWTESVVLFWEQAKGWDRKSSLRTLAKVSIFLYDELYLDRAGIKVNGITWPNKFEIEMATLPKQKSLQTPFEKVKSLFRHEISHILAGYVGGFSFDNDAHHVLFGEVGLGA